MCADIRQTAQCLCFPSQNAEFQTIPKRCGKTEPPISKPHLGLPNDFISTSTKLRCVQNLVCEPRTARKPFKFFHMPHAKNMKKTATLMNHNLKTKLIAKTFQKTPVKTTEIKL